MNKKDMRLLIILALLLSSCAQAAPSTTPTEAPSTTAPVQTATPSYTRELKVMTNSSLAVSPITLKYSLLTPETPEPRSIKPSYPRTILWQTCSTAWTTPSSAGRSAKAFLNRTSPL